MKTLQLSEEKAKELYKTAIPEFRAMLEETFGKAFFESVDTVYDAYKYLDLKVDTNLWIDGEYLKRVKAFYELSILCDAWNKQDGFVPDFNDPKQNRWFPLFSLSECGFSSSAYSPSYASVHLGSRLCLKSNQRSDEFGKKYEHLFKIFLRG